MTKKMTKQTIAMVEAANDYFRYAHIKDEHNETFNTLCWLLIQAGCYQGFNYYTLEGTLSGGKNDEFGHLEICTK